jgi:hypothetical protein
MAVEIVSFRELPAPEQGAPAPERVLSGAPAQTIWNVFADNAAQFFAGRWRSTPGRWRVSYSEMEFCYLLEGRIAITSVSGLEQNFGAGDAFVIPRGFTGVWDVKEPTTKLYVIFEPPSSFA